MISTAKAIFYLSVEGGKWKRLPFELSKQHFMETCYRMRKTTRKSELLGEIESRAVEIRGILIWSLFFDDYTIWCINESNYRGASEEGAKNHFESLQEILPE